MAGSLFGELCGSGSIAARTRQLIGSISAGARKINQ
jgi:hypothetical protein